MCLHHSNKKNLKEENQSMRYLRNSRSRTCQGESTPPVGAAVRSRPTRPGKHPLGLGSHLGQPSEGISEADKQRQCQPDTRMRRRKGQQALWPCSFGGFVFSERSLSVFTAKRKGPVDKGEVKVELEVKGPCPQIWMCTQEPVGKGTGSIGEASC